MYYNQPDYDVTGFPYWQDDVIYDTPTAETIQRVGTLLKEGKIVGWFQGRGEIGPRALGHRSILMRPDAANGKEILNNRVKHREWYRPFGPSILESAVSLFFEDHRPSPFMMRAIPARKETIRDFPAVVHVDGTSRIQTVPDNPPPEQESFAALLKEFYRQTSIPMLLNTSLNIQGKPICADTDAAFGMLNTKDEGLDAVCVGNQLQLRHNP